MGGAARLGVGCGMSDTARAETTAPHIIALRLDRPGALLPWYEAASGGRGMLDGSVTAHIIAAARLVPAGAEIRMRLEVPGGAATDAQAMLRAGLRASAAYEGEAIRELFRWGWKVLAMALMVLTLCLTIAIYGEDILPGLVLPLIVQESLKIIGWAAMWKPTELFLYDWIPMLRRRNLLARLATAPIEVHEAAA